MLNQKKVKIFLAKLRKSLAKQFLEIALKERKSCGIHSVRRCVRPSLRLLSA